MAKKALKETVAEKKVKEGAARRKAEQTYALAQRPKKQGVSRRKPAKVEGVLELKALSSTTPGMSTLRTTAGVALKTTYPRVVIAVQKDFEMDTDAAEILVGLGVGDVDEGGQAAAALLSEIAQGDHLVVRKIGHLAPSVT